MPKKKNNSAIKMDQNWEAKHEARTLAEAETIKSDPKRFNRAKKAAKQMAKDSEKETKALKRIAKK